MVDEKINILLFGLFLKDMYGVFNPGGDAWNITFHWDSINLCNSPKGYSTPQYEILKWKISSISETE